MVPNLKFKTTLILAILILAAFSIAYKDMTLGLDLSGGSSLRYRLPEPDDMEGRTMKEILDQTVAVFRKRVQGYGLKEIPIRPQGDDELLIELPGMTEVQANEIINLIESQGQLEWMLVAETESDDQDPSISVEVDKERDRLIEYLRQVEADKDGWDLTVDLSPLTFERTINERRAHYKWIAWDRSNIEEERGLTYPEPGTTLDTLIPDLAENPDKIKGYFELMKRFADPAWQFGGPDLASVGPGFDQNQNPAVRFDFKADRARDFGDFTKAHINKLLAILLDGELTSAPRINSEIPGSGIISGPGHTGFKLEEQKHLLTILRSGSLDVKPQLLFKNTIGPTLGDDSILRGKIAMMVGMSSVFIFLIIYYLFAGIVASIALTYNLTLLIGMLVFLEATLTLPGIAGIVLTVGMAVDANILIFERIREEMDKGKTLAQSVKNGFERAFITIVDANVTTFITGFFLFYFGTGPIKGFAWTLMAGICTSLFSALLVSKVIFALLIEKDRLKSLKMMRLLKSPKVNFLKAMPPAGMISVLVIIAGLVCFFMADDSKYGLDFTGGYNVHLKCVEGTTQAEVLNRLGETYPNVRVVSITESLEQKKKDPSEQFDVKIKETESRDEALAREEAALKEGRDVAQDYLNVIKAQLGDRLIKDPITSLEVVPDEATQTAKIAFDLNLAQPVDRAAVESALGTLFRIDDIQMNGSGDVNAMGDVASVKGAYNDPTISKNLMQSRITTQITDAVDRGMELKLLDPFPLTGFIGPTVGHQLRDAAVISIVLSLAAIIAYIRMRFREYKYGFAAAAALVHDVLITLGAVAVGRLTGLVDVEIGLPLIAAFLTIIGYSLNDTIVVFDRVRENLPRINLPFRDLLNLSINQTLSRTILTSLTTLGVVAILFILNYGQRNVMEGFSFALIVGVIVGTYSSVFVASPVLLYLHSREEEVSDEPNTRREKKKTAKV